MPNTDPIEEFARRLSNSLQDGSFVRLILSGPVQPINSPERILGRLVELKGVPTFSLTFRHATQDITKNLPILTVADWLRQQLPAHFCNALLGTVKREWQLFAPVSGLPRLVGHRPTITTPPGRAHDQTRQLILDDSAHDWLRGLNVIDLDGHVRPSMADKYRQINRHLEILCHLITECEWETNRSTESTTTATEPKSSEYRIADMGCGKGYLTFGAWHLLHRVRKLPVRLIGVEQRQGLVATTNQLARQIGATGLSFTQGTIASTNLPALDALIALHACNTATDDAIARGIGLGAQLIVVAPCCYQEVRPQLGQPAPLSPVLVHGIMAERMAEWATDGLRALFLEWAGYRPKVFEFVPAEHTPKNLMIAAVRVREPFTNETVRHQIEDFKIFFGIQHHALDPLLQRHEPPTMPDRK